MSLGLLLLGILLLFLLRVPMAFAILGPCLAYLITEDYSLGLAIRLAMAGINSWPLLAVPLFILLGIVATRTEIADRLYDAALLSLGRLRAGLAYVNIGVSLAFSWMSGAALADAAGIGSIEVGHMRKKGYPAEFSVGLSASSALISPIMPPSIPAIVYASVAAVSTGALFAAAVLPALLVTISLVITVYIWARRRPDLVGEPFDARVVRRALLRAIPPMGAPVIILGGILGGIFTPTEAAGIGALYMLVLALSYRTVRLPDLVGIFRDTAVVTAQIMIIIGASALLSWILARERVPEHVAEALLGFTSDPLMFLLVINVLLIILGMLLEPTSALLIITPILLPVAVEYGIDPLHFGSIIIFNLMIGLLTPPMGGVAFVLSSVTGIPVEKVFRGALIYFPALLIVLAAVTYLPEITLWLPRALGLN
ncbi:MAG TPA: TRAP transporter large permease [Candidatus Limnocylindrales bacterium]|nr:TRAP transporter large permease [Candidatus Limnocylindrales bacterium]